MVPVKRPGLSSSSNIAVSNAPQRARSNPRLFLPASCRSAVALALLTARGIWADIEKASVPGLLEYGNTWANSQYKAMRDALEAGAAVTCTFVFDGETLVNEDVYLIGVTKRYQSSYDVKKIREFEVEVREVA